MTSTTLSSEFDNEFQKKVILALVTNKPFLEQVIDIIKPEYFDSEAQEWVVRLIMQIYNERKMCLTLTILKNEAKVHSAKSGIKALVIELARYLFSGQDQLPSDLEYVQEKFIEFCKFQELKNAFMQGVDMLQRNDVSKSGTELIRLFNRAAQAGENRDLGHIYHDSLDARVLQSTRKTVETPWQCINNVTDGGLGAGELGCIIAPSGIGKSWFLRAIGSHAMRISKNVADYTLELSENYVGLRYDAFFTGIEPTKIRYHVDVVRERLAGIPGKSYIKYFPVRSVTVQALASHMKRMASFGDAPDLVIVDYADLMRSIEKAQAKHEELGYIYEELRSMLAEFGVPGWTASQSQRSAAKDDVIEGDKIAGAYAKIMACDLILSANRTSQDKNDKTTRVHVVKNRNGPDGMTFPAIMDLENVKIDLYDPSSPEGIALLERTQNEWLPASLVPRGFDPAH